MVWIWLCSKERLIFLMIARTPQLLHSIALKCKNIIECIVNERFNKDNAGAISPFSG